MAITLGPFRARVREAGPDDIGADPGAGCEVAAELVVAELAEDGDGDDDVEDEGEAERDTADTTEEGRVTAAELPMLFEIPRPQTPLVLQ